jgi:hypothetical protein
VEDIEVAESRTLPRPFNMHWGSGQITEEAGYDGEWKQSRIQLMEYTEGEAAGGWSIRFCYYSHDGRFQRGPLMLDEQDIEGLRLALESTPKLRQILSRMVSPSPNE